MVKQNLFQRFRFQAGRQQFPWFTLLLVLVVSCKSAQLAKKGDPAYLPLEPSQAQLILQEHNKARLAKGLQSLVWSDEVAQSADAWANVLGNGGCLSLRHSQSSYGENLYAASGGAGDAADPVRAWVAEEANYNYTDNRCSGVCGHYTQVVWAQSRRLGCASRSCGAAVVWVCQYDPPGNVVGRRPY